MVTVDNWWEALLYICCNVNYYNSNFNLQYSICRGTQILVTQFFCLISSIPCFLLNRSENRNYNNTSGKHLIEIYNHQLLSKYLNSISYIVPFNWWYFVAQKKTSFSPFSFIKNKRLLTLEICYLRAMLPIQSGVTALSNGSLVPFLFEFKLSGSGVTALCCQ
jgi:hypothetical protein